MKTIIWKENSISPWLFDDAKIITMKSNQIDVGDPDNLEFIIGDMNSENSTLIEGVTAPEDGWVGTKFTYIDGEWAIVEGWVDPEEAAA